MQNSMIETNIKSHIITLIKTRIIGWNKIVKCIGRLWIILSFVPIRKILLNYYFPLNLLVNNYP